MALIQDTVGTLPYLLTDFDQHSYEAQDCFTRYMPKTKLDTAVRPILMPSGQKALLANERIVSAFEKEHDLDKARRGNIVAVHHPVDHLSDERAAL
jgi:hypothetical protein